MKLKLVVNGQSLRIISSGAELVSDTINYVTADCMFSEEWSGLDKWLHMRSPNGAVYDMALGESPEPLTLNLSEAGLWTLWVHGFRVDGDSAVLRITTTSAAFRVERSGIHGRVPLPELPLSAQEQIAFDAAHAKAEVQALRQEMDQLDQTVLDVEANAKLAVEARDGAEQCLNKLPYPDPATKTWWRWNGKTGAYEDTGEYSQGIQGPRGEQGLPGADLLAPGSVPLHIGHDDHGSYINIANSEHNKNYLAVLDSSGIPEGAAPAGFGFGEKPRITANLDAEQTSSIVATVDAHCVGLPPSGANNIVITCGHAGEGGFLIQMAYSRDLLCWLERRFERGVWQVWEYVIPPMYPGMEYRTTQRFHGRAVYTKLINCGSWAKGKRVAYIESSALSQPVSLSVVQSKITYPYQSNTLFATIVSNEILLDGSSDPWGGEVLATVKYTKVGV